MKLRRGRPLDSISLKIRSEALMDSRTDPRVAATRRLFWAALVLAVSLVAIKAGHLGLPRRDELATYGLSTIAISYADVVFAAGLWAAARCALMLAGRRTWALRLVPSLFVAFSAFYCLYAVVNVVLFGILGGFLTYPLLAIIGDVRMLRSSIGAHLTPATTLGLVGVPSLYVVSVLALGRAAASERWSRWRTVPIAVVVVWTGLGAYAYENHFDRRADRRIAESPYWALASSTWESVTGRGFVRMTDGFASDDLADFDPPAARRERSASLSSRMIRRAAAALDVRAAAARRPPNV